MKRVSYSLLISVLLLLCVSVVQARERAFRFGISLGVTATPGFESYMEDHDDDGSAAMVGPVLSGKVRFADHWSVVPTIAVLLSTDSIDGTLGLAQFNVYLRYTARTTAGFFLQAGPHVSSASGGGSSDITAGVGGAASLGYAFRRLELETGYNYMPVDATSGHGRRIETEENFGGPYVRVGFRF